MTNRDERPIKHFSATDYHLQKNFFMTGYKAYHEVQHQLNDSERKVCLWLIDNIDFSKNIVIAKYNDIVKGAKVSRGTVADTLKRLRALGLIKQDTGIIFISPDWHMDGGNQKYAMLRNSYLSL